MQKYNYLIGLLLTVLTYFVLELVYVPWALSVCLKNDCQLTGNVSSLLNTETIVFCILILLLVIIISKNKNDVKTYIQTITFLFILIYTSLLLNLILINHLSKFKLDPTIINQISIDYNLFYFTPTTCLIPVFFKQILTLFDAKTIVLKYKFLSHSKLDFRILRLISKLIDISIVIFLALIFSKVIVIYPNTPLVTLVGLYLYIFTIEYSLGTSIGKLLFGLHVIGTKNNQLSGFRIFIRTIGRLIPFYPIGILFNYDGLHDYISATKVVKIKTGA